MLYKLEHRNYYYYDVTNSIELKKKVILEGLSFVGPCQFSFLLFWHLRLEYSQPNIQVMLINFMFFHVLCNVINQKTSTVDTLTTRQRYQRLHTFIICSFIYYLFIAVYWKPYMFVHSKIQKLECKLF